MWVNEWKLLSHVWLFVTLWTCSSPGSSVHRILQARVLEWVAVPFSRGSSWPRNWTRVSCIVGGFFTSWATGNTASNASQKLRKPGVQLWSRQPQAATQAVTSRNLVSQAELLTTAMTSSRCQRPPRCRSAPSQTPGRPCSSRSGAGAAEQEEELRENLPARVSGELHSPRSPVMPGHSFWVSSETWPLPYVM